MVPIKNSYNFVKFGQSKIKHKNAENHYEKNEIPKKTFSVEKKPIITGFVFTVLTGIAVAFLNKKSFSLNFSKVKDKIENFMSNFLKKEECVSVKNIIEKKYKRFKALFAPRKAKIYRMEARKLYNEKNSKKMIARIAQERSNILCEKNGDKLGLILGYLDEAQFFLKRKFNKAQKSALISYEKAKAIIESIKPEDLQNLIDKDSKLYRGFNSTNIKRIKDIIEQQIRTLKT